MSLEEHKLELEKISKENKKAARSFGFVIAFFIIATYLWLVAGSWLGALVTGILVIASIGLALPAMVSEKMEKEYRRLINEYEIGNLTVNEFEQLLEGVRKEYDLEDTPEDKIKKNSVLKDDGVKKEGKEKRISYHRANYSELKTINKQRSWITAIVAIASSVFIYVFHTNQDTLGLGIAIVITLMAALDFKGETKQQVIIAEYEKLIRQAEEDKITIETLEKKSEKILNNLA